ncbi:UNVERIFIED_CONTAM: hypothetical protein FKN15_052747 [Acipenser sinensis]
MADTAAKSSETYMFQYKGYNFPKDMVTPEYIDSLEDFEIRDSDVFLVTYLKSGTVWTQQIIILIHEEGSNAAESQGSNAARSESSNATQSEGSNAAESDTNMKRMPWLEYNLEGQDYNMRPSPRLFTSHLTYNLMPKMLKEKKAKVIYVARNPKDAMVSLFHFSKMWTYMETAKNIGDLMEKYLSGQGTVGDWKNTLTVAQSEHFDEVYRQRMKDLPLKFVWDLNEDAS